MTFPSIEEEEEEETHIRYTIVFFQTIPIFRDLTKEKKCMRPDSLQHQSV